MSILKRFYNLVIEKLSGEIDAASDPEEKIRLALHDLEETGPAVRSAVAGQLAKLVTAQNERNVAANKVTDLTAKVQAAVESGNSEVARIRGGQLLDAKAALEKAELRLTETTQKADKAREEFADWKRKTGELQTKALDALDENQRAEAQEKFNEAMQKVDTTAVDSTIAQAMDSITDRAARADAAATLDDDPDEKALRDAEKATRESDVADLLAQFAPKPETESATAN